MMHAKIDVPPATTLGTATVENRAPFRRRVMQVVTLPLKDSDGFRLGDPVTVANPGTGQDERAQVERWALPYASGHERIVRLSYPAVLPALTLRNTHSFSVSGGGALPTRAFSSRVQTALDTMSITFFCGPKSTHWVTVYSPGAPATRTTYNGTRSEVRQYFARVYEPSHAPSVRTQFWCEVEMELFHDEDTIECYFRFGLDDPRIATPVTVMDGFAVGDREIGFDLSMPTQHVAQPVVHHAHTYVRSLTWAPSRWRWIIDQKTLGQDGVTDINREIGWGAQVEPRVTLTCAGLSGTIGDALRDDTIRAWRSGTSMIGHPGISNDWVANAEAFGPHGGLPRRPKLHEQWDRRDATWIRQRLESFEVDYAYGANTPVATCWTSNESIVGGTGGLLWPPHAPGGGAAAPHGDGGHTHMIAALYVVPGLAHYFERALLANPFPMFFREIDGRPFEIENHPTTWVTECHPSVGSGRDSHGKTTSYVQGRGVRGERTGASSYNPPDAAHFDETGSFCQAALFGSRALRKRCFDYAQMAMGGYPLMEFRRGAQSQFRAFARYVKMMAWSVWLLADDVVNAWFKSSLVDWILLPAIAVARAQWPNAIIKIENVSGSLAGGTGLLRTHARYWEGTFGVSAAKSLQRLLGHVYPTESATIYQWAKDRITDTFRYDMTRDVDESDGRVLWTYYPPFQGGGRYGLAVAVAWLDHEALGGGHRKLTQAEWRDNNEERRILGLPQWEGLVNTTTNEMTYITPLAMLAAGSEIVADQGPALMRYVSEKLQEWPLDRPGSNLLLDWMRFGLRWYPCSAATDLVRVGTTTSRGTFGVTPSDIAISIDTADSLWLTGPATGQLRRMLRADGSITATIDPPGTGPTAGWTGVACYRDGGQALLALLDGNDPSLNRASYKITVMREAAPTVLHQTTTFAYPGGTKRDGRAIAWDPAVGAWLVLARDSLSVQTLWLVYPGSTEAVQYTGALIDLTGVESIAIDRDGKLLAMCDAASTIHVYGRGDGGIWGVPRSITTTITSARYCAFTDHARTDDAQRLVTTTVGTPVKETEI